MKLASRMLLGSVIGLGLVASACPQDKPATQRLLVIQREFVKPGKGGAAHEKTEAAFVQAFAHAKYPTRYIAFQSMSGKPRVLFFTNYDSYDAWEKDAQSAEKNAILSAALERANETDGALLDAADQGVFTYEPDLSFNTKPDLSHRRYLEIWGVRVKPGKDREWRELTKLWISHYSKAVPNGHWGAYQAVYGVPNGTYLLLTARDNAAELDRGPMEDKAIMAELGEDNMKKLDEMFADCVQESESQLFSISASMSYPPEEYIKANPEFWQKKAPVMAAEKKSDAKAMTVAEKKTP